MCLKNHIVLQSNAKGSILNRKVAWFLFILKYLRQRYIIYINIILFLFVNLLFLFVICAKPSSKMLPIFKCSPQFSTVVRFFTWKTVVQKKTVLS